MFCDFTPALRKMIDDRCMDACQNLSNTGMSGICVVSCVVSSLNLFFHSFSQIQSKKASALHCGVETQIEKEDEDDGEILPQL